MKKNKHYKPKNAAAGGVVEEKAPPKQSTPQTQKQTQAPYSGPVRLGLRDRRILFELDRNCRASNAEIGRRTRVSEHAVAHRIERLRELGVIKSFYAVVDRAKLGCTYFRVFLKLQNIGADSENNVLDYLNANPNVVWAAPLRGRWDVLFTVFARDADHLFEILEELTEKHGREVAGKQVVLGKVHAFTGMHILRESELTDSEARLGRNEFVYGGKTADYELDDLDERILAELAVNARARFKEIAARTGASIDTIRNRVKSLQERRILTGFRTMLSLRRIGLVYHDVIVRLSHAKLENFSRIYAYCAECPEVCFVVRCIGAHELELEVATASVDEFDAFAARFRQAFARDVRDMESLRVIRERKISFYK